MNSLSGKTLFISGASRGIGLAIALRAAKDGANIAIIAIGCVIVGVVLLLCAILLYSLVSVVREGTKN